MGTLVWHTVLYGFEIWGLGLLEFDWSSAERVQIILLRHIIRCKHTVPQPIVLTKFGAQLFRLETVFGLFTLLNHL